MKLGYDSYSLRWQGWDAFQPQNVSSVRPLPRNTLSARDTLDFSGTASPSSLSPSVTS